MGEGTSILLELAQAQGADVADAFDGGRAHVGRECLVTEDRETFLQRELEPVAAGDPVAGPVVEVLVANHGLDLVIVGVRGRVGACQDKLVVEDVETLVFHGPEIEGADRDNVEDVEVVFATEGVFVPFHRALEGAHGKVDLVFVAVGHVDAKLHASARTRDEGVFALREVAGHEGKQIGRLGERVVPLGHVAAARQCRVAGGIAVRQQDREAGAVGDHPHAIDRHVVGPVIGIGDAAEALGLALRAEHAVGHVETRQRRVGGGVDLDRCVDAEPRGGRVADDELIGRDLEGGLVEGAAVKLDVDEFQLLSVEDKRSPVVALAFDMDRGKYPGCRFIEVELELGARDAVGRGPVVQALDGDGLFGLHRAASFAAPGLLHFRLCATGVPVPMVARFYCCMSWSTWRRMAAASCASEATSSGTLPASIFA